jgi:hypothetical protein
MMLKMPPICSTAAGISSQQASGATIDQIGIDPSAGNVRSTSCGAPGVVRAGRLSYSTGTQCHWSGTAANFWDTSILRTALPVTIVAVAQPGEGDQVSIVACHATAVAISSIPSLQLVDVR